MKISICLNSCIGLALHEINHPAITICSQGMNEEDLNDAIKNQFERFVLEAKSKNITGQNYRIKRSTGSIFNATIFVIVFYIFFSINALVWTNARKIGDYIFTLK